MISSLLPIDDIKANEKALEINSHLRDHCKAYNFVYVDNSNMTTGDLYDAVHLTREGRVVLVDNFAFYMNKYWLGISPVIPIPEEQSSFCDLESNTSKETASECDILKLKKARNKNICNPLFAYYNINSLRYKFNDLKEILHTSPPDVLVLAETKLDKSFPNAQFFLNEYFEPTRKDYNCQSGGIIEYIRKGIIRKRLVELELTSFESIASEITIKNNKTFLLSFYRTERNENRLSNIKKFFQELSSVLDKVTEKFDDIIIMGDINIDFHDKKTPGFQDLKDFQCKFGLSNLIKDKTCFFRNNESSIDCILTNNPRKYFNSFALELGVSDCHKMIGAFSRKHLSRQKTKVIRYDL